MTLIMEMSTSIATSLTVGTGGNFPVHASPLSTASSPGPHCPPSVRYSFCIHIWIDCAPVYVSTLVMYVFNRCQSLQTGISTASSHNIDSTMSLEICRCFSKHHYITSFLTTQTYGKDTETLYISPRSQ